MRLQSNIRLFFQSLLRQILDAEYSVKWNVLRAEEYGVPQYRERVVFILSWYSPKLISAYHVQSRPTPS
jgi:site-specific DNA-cytosine methylase